jgi:hypothetical protein
LQYAKTRLNMLSTEELLSRLEQITALNLRGFADQFVYGTGLPEVYYTYRFEPKPEGGFRVVGEARQKTPRRFRYKVTQTPGGALDVARQPVDQIQVAQSTLAVPVEINVYDPKNQSKKAKSGANSAVRGGIRLQGETTPIKIDLDYEPKEFWLDKDAEVFGLFWDEKRNPKQALYFQGQEAAEAGKAAESEALFDRAYKAEDEPPEYGGTVYYDVVQYTRRLKNALIDRARARLFLD